MPDGGTLTIQTSNATESPEQHDSLAMEGRYVSMQVRDTGDGMTPDAKQHVFEPFFTTKPVGQGHGIGPVCRLRNCQAAEWSHPR